MRLAVWVEGKGLGAKGFRVYIYIYRERERERALGLGGVEVLGFKVCIKVWNPLAMALQQRRAHGLHCASQLGGLASRTTCTRKDLRWQEFQILEGAAL